MPQIREGNRWTRAASGISLVLATAALGHGQEAPPGPVPPDSTLYTTYELFSSNQSILWIVCGSTQQSSGCYAAGNLGPFTGVGALLECNPRVRLNTVTRAIYVLDAGAAGPVTLYVYTKTDTVTPSSDVVSVGLTDALSLPLVGGPGVSCSMAANDRFLFIGTDQSPAGARVRKRDLEVTPLGGFSPPLNVSAITSNQYGYVTVTHGDFGQGPSGFYLFGPDGNLEEDGGGATFLLSTTQAVLTAALP